MSARSDDDRGVKPLTSSPSPGPTDPARSRPGSPHGPRWCWQAVVGGVVFPITWLVLYAYSQITNGDTFSQLSGPRWVWANLLLLLCIGGMPLAGPLLGVIAMFKIHRSHGSLKGKELAIVAIAWSVAAYVVAEAVGPVPFPGGEM